jgi:hypothetical protein
VKKSFVLVVLAALFATMLPASPASAVDPCFDMERVVRGQKDGTKWSLSRGAGIVVRVKDRDIAGCGPQSGETGSWAIIQMVNASDKPQNAYIRVGWVEQEGCIDTVPLLCNQKNWGIEAEYGYYFTNGEGGQAFRCFSPCDENRRRIGQAQGIAFLNGFQVGALCSFDIHRIDVVTIGGKEYGRWKPEWFCEGDQDGQKNEIIGFASRDYFEVPYVRGRPQSMTHRFGGESTGMSDYFYQVKTYESGSWYGWVNNACFLDNATNWDANRDSTQTYAVEKVRSDGTPTC